MVAFPHNLSRYCQFSEGQEGDCLNFAIALLAPRIMEWPLQYEAFQEVKGLWTEEQVFQTQHTSDLRNSASVIAAAMNGQHLVRLSKGRGATRPKLKNVQKGTQLPTQTVSALVNCSSRQLAMVQCTRSHSFLWEFIFYLLPKSSQGDLQTRFFKKCKNYIETTH